MTTKQLDLLDQRPRVIECTGPELSGVLERVRGDGGIIHGMAVVCVSSWRVSVSWPNEKATPAAQAREPAPPSATKAATSDRWCFNENTQHACHAHLRKGGAPAANDDGRRAQRRDAAPVQCPQQTDATNRIERILCPANLRWSEHKVDA